MKLPSFSDAMISRLELLLLALVVVLLFALYFLSGDDRPSETAQQAHQVTATAVRVVLQRDTVFVHDTIAAAAARGDYAHARDTLRITDTVQVRATLAKADVALAKDAAALQSAAALVAGHVDVEAALRTELVIAQRPPPRFSGVGQALYDPFAHTPALAGELHVRVRGNWSLLTRAEQRFEPGARPRGYVGLTVSF